MNSVLYTETFNQMVGGLHLKVYLQDHKYW